MNESMGKEEYVTNPEADVEEFRKELNNLDGEAYEEALDAELKKYAVGEKAESVGTESDVEAFEEALDTEAPEDMPSGNDGSSENDLPLTLEEMDDAKKRTSPTDPFGRPIQVNDPWGNAEGRQLK